MAVLGLYCGAQLLLSLQLIDSGAQAQLVVAQGLNCSSVCGILAPRDHTCVIGRWMLSHWTTRGSPIPEFKTKSRPSLKLIWEALDPNRCHLPDSIFFLRSSPLTARHWTPFWLFLWPEPRLAVRRNLGDMALLSIHGTPHHLGTWPCSHSQVSLDLLWR